MQETKEIIMKKSLIILTAILLISTFSYAETFNVTTEAITTKPKASSPQGKASIFTSMTAEKFTAGLNYEELNVSRNTWKLTPYLIFKGWENAGLKIGYSKNNAGKEFLQLGPVFAGTKSKFTWYLQPVANFSTSAESKGQGYLDVFAGTLYPITSKLSIGGEVYADYSWSKNKFASGIGPLVSYSLTEETTIYFRTMQHVDENWEGSAVEMKVGVSYNF
jgi:hypothetical protein